MDVELDRWFEALDDLAPSDLWERIEGEAARPTPYVVDGAVAPGEAVRLPELSVTRSRPRSPQRDGARVLVAAAIVVVMLLVAVVLVRPGHDDDRVSSGPPTEPWRAVGSTSALRGPVSIAVGADGASVWVLNTSATLVELDPSTLEVRRTFALGHVGTRDLAVGTSSSWVVHSDGFVSRIDPTTGAMTSIAVPGDPRQVAAIDDEAWVVLGSGGIVELVVDGAGAVAEGRRVSIPGARSVAVTSSSVWVTDDSGVRELDRSGVQLARLTGLPGPGPVTVGSDGRVWFGLATDVGEVGYLDPQTHGLLGAHDVGLQPTVLGSGGTRIWAADGRGSLVVFDAATVVTEQPLAIGTATPGDPARDPVDGITDVAAAGDDAWLAVPGRGEVVHVRAER